MPFVLAHVNVPVSREQETEIKTRMGQAIERIPGKNENVLLFGIEANGHLYLLRNGTQKMAYIEASIFGDEDHEGFDAFAVAATDIFRQVLGIPAENIRQIYTYVKNQQVKESEPVSGMLLYAGTDEEIVPDIEYSMSGNKIAVRTLDLNQEFAGIRKELDEIAEKYLN